MFPESGCGQTQRRWQSINLTTPSVGRFSRRRIMHRYLHTVDGDGYFDPETVIILGSAFDEAWRSLQNSGVYFTSARTAEATRERLAQRIVECAKGGERDPGLLRDKALNDLARSNLSQLKRRTDTGL
jgi:hypothetical protein